MNEKATMQKLEWASKPEAIRLQRRPPFFAEASQFGGLRPGSSEAPLLPPGRDEDDRGELAIESQRTDPVLERLPKYPAV
jgi:hypothetical protein